MSNRRIGAMSDLPESRRTAVRRGSRARVVLWIVLALVLLLIFAVAWVGARGLLAKRHLEQSVALVSTLRSEITDGDTSAAQKTAKQLDDHASSARSLTGDPIWGAAQYTPFFGTNLRAVREVAVVVDDVATGSVRPVARVIGNLNQEAFTPKNGRIDLQPLVDAQPAVARATKTLANATTAADRIDTGATLSPVTSAVDQLRNALGTVSQQAITANKIVQLAPTMLGHDGDRDYVLLFQNNAELRAGGGIPGAVALLQVRDGAISLGNQASGASFGPYDKPVLALSPETTSLYGDITGRYMQDVNLTPRFNVTGALAREMWKQKFGQQVDGVLAIDPVTLGYILRATGPVQLPSGDTLTSGNAAKLLLSDVYAKYPDPKVQDAFFASAASAVFEKVSSGGFDTKKFIAALTDGTKDGRLRLWSADKAEQKQITGTALAGDLPTASAQTREFGVYLNDGTGSKMDYYLDKKVAVGSSVCRKDGRPTSVVEVTLKNTAPADAATSLPEYVTGGGAFGTEPGKIKTLVAVYAPAGAIYLGATQDGKGAGLQTVMDGDHPVAQLRTLLAPGESTTFRVAFLGDAKFAKAGVQAESTPGVRQSEAEPLQFDCSAPTPVG
jgi:nitrate reductase NapE component